MGMLRVVEPYTGLLWEKNLRNEFTGNFPWFETDQQPLIADFDQNGTMDVFAVSGYGTYTPDFLNIGRAFLLEAGLGTCPEWLMFRHDVNRTSYLSAEEVEMACAITGVEESYNSTVITISPNPNTGQFTIGYDFEASMKVRPIQVFNTLGQIVETILPLANSGNQEVILDQPPGLYFLCYKIGSQQFVKRMVIGN